MASSDFSSTYMLGVRLVAFPSRPGTRVRAWMRPPRFRAKNFSTCTRSPTARGSSHASHSPWDDVAFSSTEGDRHLGIRPVSQLNTRPVVSPVNASRRPSRTPRITRGRSGWLDLPRGGLSPPILCQLSWRTPKRVKLRNTQYEQMSSALPPTADVGLAPAKSLGGVGAFDPVSPISCYGT